MKKYQTVFVSCALAFIVGLIVGKAYTQEGAVIDKTNLVVLKEAIKNNRIRSIEKKRNQIVSESEKCNLQRLAADKKMKLAKSDSEDGYNEYELQQQYNESVEKWNQSVRDLFSEYTDDSEGKFQKYKDIKKQLDEQHGQAYSKMIENSKVSENEYIFNWSYQDDKKLLAIRTKYHKQLENILGDKLYTRLQQKIREYHTKRMENARKGLPRGANIDF